MLSLTPSIAKAVNYMNELWVWSIGRIRGRGGTKYPRWGENRYGANFFHHRSHVG